jgi:hypothetical protein
MFWVYRGNGDSIKHAYQLIQALLKNSETELMNLLPSTNKSRSTTITSNHESEGEISKIQRTNTGPRLQNNGKDNFLVSILTLIFARTCLLCHPTVAY